MGNIKIEHIEINKLKPATYNPRQMTDKQASDLENSIRKFGFVDPLVVNQHTERMNVVIGGHQRLKIAEKLGMTLVPVVYVELDEMQEKELNLRLNKNTGEWDLKALANFDIEVLADIGWNIDELEVIFQDDSSDQDGHSDSDSDNVPDPPSEPVAKYGDLFQLGRHRLLCGDSTRREDVERLMGGVQADMVFTSPPYSDQREYHIGSFSWDKLMVSVFKNVISLVVDEGTHILVNMGMSHKNRSVDPYWDKWLTFMANHGYPLFGWYVWDKGCGMPGEWSGRLAPAHEYIFHFNQKCSSANKWVETKTYNDMTTEQIEQDKKSKTFRKKDGSLKRATSLNKVGQHYKVPDSVIRISRAVTGGSIVSNHPAVFPIELPEFGCRTWTDENALLFEPFGGSGSTLIACEKTNRRCCMMEIDPCYIDVIIKRWEDYTGKEAIKL